MEVTSKRVHYELANGVGISEFPGFHLLQR